MRDILFKKCDTRSTVYVRLWALHAVPPRNAGLCETSSPDLYLVPGLISLAQLITLAEFKENIWLDNNPFMQAQTPLSHRHWFVEHPQLMNTPALTNIAS